MEVETLSCSIEGFINLVCRVPNDSPCEGALSGYKLRLVCAWADSLHLLSSSSCVRLLGCNTSTVGGKIKARPVRREKDGDASVSSIQQEGCIPPFSHQRAWQTR